MSLFIALGTNLGNKTLNLTIARDNLENYFKFIGESSIYTSSAIEYENQPDFYNQVMEFEIPTQSPAEVMEILLKIELDMGRQRDIPKGPRVIDLDLLFYGDQTIKTPLVEVPHPRYFDRSFVVLPLRELPGYKLIKNTFSFPQSFSNFSRPL